MEDLKSTSTNMLLTTLYELFEEYEFYRGRRGLEDSKLIGNIAHFIPFLPLEREHLVQCLEREVKKINQIMSNNLVEQVLQELQFIPDENPIFADGGCKIVSEKVQFFITRQQRRNRKNRYRIL